MFACSAWLGDGELKTNMSRWYRTGEEQQGYDDRKEADRWASYPYERSHDYREGWDDAARDERRAQERREEERAEQEAAERAEERRQHEAAQMRRAEEEAFYEQQQPEPCEPPAGESPNTRI